MSTDASRQAIEDAAMAVTDARDAWYHNQADGNAYRAMLAAEGVLVALDPKNPALLFS